MRKNGRALRRARLTAAILAVFATVALSSCGKGSSVGAGGQPPVPTYRIGGTVSGLTGADLVLQNNGGNNLPISTNGAFTFTNAIASGATYAVTVLTHPISPNQNCTITNGSGMVGSTNVTGVSITCGSIFSIGGTVSGLVGQGMVLQNSGGDNRTISTNGAFTFATGLASGAAYAVTVLTQPTGPNQTCTVTNDSGTVSANVTNISVACVLESFSIDAASGPLATQQWHLKNTGQTAYADSAGVVGMDINVEPVYSVLGIVGNGVIAAVVDTGLQIAHEDLVTNVVAGGSWNFTNNTTNPTNTVATTGDHGTSVGGLIAMARNTVGGIGVAPAARLKGFNFLRLQSVANNVSSLGGSASNPVSNDVFVLNQSYGTDNTDDVLINSTVAAQYLSGVTTLRGGKGALYVKSAGNGFNGFGSPAVPCGAANAAGLSCQSANFDPTNTIPYQIVVGATNASGIKSSYSTAGSAIWVGAPGGEFGNNASVNFGLPAVAYEPAMITTDQSGCTNGYSRTGSNSSTFNNGGAPNTSCNYTNTFNGTSSAAPVTAGAIALILEANPALTWRDVKHILASTARQIDASRAAVRVALSNGLLYEAEPAWTTNAAGFRFHNWYGFGMVDASAAVNMARNSYTLLGAFANTFVSSPAISVAIPDNSVTGASHTLAVPGSPVQVVEVVQISVTATHTYTGDLGIELTSPSGTRSVLKNIRDGFGGSANLSGMVLLSNAFYGESASGNWTIKIVDGAALDTGTLTGWTIRVYGR